MIKFLNPLASVETMQKIADDIHQSQSIITRTTRYFLLTKKGVQPNPYIFSISHHIHNDDDHLYYHEHGLYACFSHQKETPKINDIKEYYQSLNISFKRQTLYYLLALVTVILLGLYLPFIPRSITGWIGITLMIITVLRSVSQQRFTKKLYIPFLKEHGFYDKELQNRFILKSSLKLNKNTLDNLKEHGSLEFLKQRDEHYFYQLLTFESRLDIMKSIKHLNLDSLEIFSTVRD